MTVASHVLLTEPPRTWTPAQEAWLAAFRAFAEAHGLEAFMDVRVIRPSDMPGCLERLTGGRVL